MSIKGQIYYDLQAPPVSPFEDGIPQDIWDKAIDHWTRRGIYEPSDEQITDMCMEIWNDESEWEREP